MLDVKDVSTESFFPSSTPIRRLIWESLGDIRKINKYLLFLCISLVGICLIESSALYLLIRRPPNVITQDQGYLQWRTTEVFILQPSMLRSYLDTVMGRLFNIVPGNYDLEPLISLNVASEILAAFGEEAITGESIRLSQNKRQLYQILDIRQTEDDRFPNYYAFLVRGEETVFENKNLHSVSQSLHPASKVVFHTAYVEKRRPRPDNPWGLALVGIRNWDTESGAAKWLKSKPLATSPISL